MDVQGVLIGSAAVTAGSRLLEILLKRDRRPRDEDQVFEGDGED